MRPRVLQCLFRPCRSRGGLGIPSLFGQLAPQRHEEAEAFLEVVELRLGRGRGVLAQEEPTLTRVAGGGRHIQKPRYFLSHQMTQRYSHLRPEALEATIRLLEDRTPLRAAGDSLEKPNG